MLEPRIGETHQGARAKYLVGDSQQASKPIGTALRGATSLGFHSARAEGQRPIKLWRRAG